MDKLIPYNVEQRMRDLGARYSRGLIPFAPFTVTDGNLITGQNPASARATAQKVADVLH